MITLLSIVTSVKDYIEIANKLIETSTPLTGGSLPLQIRDYTEIGAVCTFIVLSLKEFLTSFLSFTWLSQVWSLPLIVPDIASAMISEVSVLDSYFTNAFSFLETGLSVNAQTASLSAPPIVFGFEKFITGFINSFFLFLPTSTSHLIILRRFVMQGLEAGYIAGLGTIAGNFLWLASIILGWRFIVIPWLSFDIFRYILGFVLLVKYLWDSSKDANLTTNRTILEDNTKKNIFLLNFLLALTEQTSLYPFISNISFGADGSILESFSGPIFDSQNAFGFIGIHGLYLLGILLGCLSLLNFTVWFWENPAFSIYMWMISSYRVTTSSYYKVLNFIFLYLTMLCAISSIPYFGFDYTISNPLGLIPQDKIIDQKSLDPNKSNDKLLPETSFLGVKPTDKNSRIRDGVHARRERWKERLIKYQAYDASLYDQGVYDILTLEDLNYGFDRFWLRRKMRNHQIRFRLFPGPWMRSLKKQLNKPGFTGPRVEFFRILFEQYYHPSFHATITKNKKNKDTNSGAYPSNYSIASNYNNTVGQAPVGAWPKKQPSPSGGLAYNSDINKSLLLGYEPRSMDTYNALTKKNLIKSEYSALRKFSRNFNNRINLGVSTKQIPPLAGRNNVTKAQDILSTVKNKNIYSKSLKSLFSKISKVDAVTKANNGKAVYPSTPESLNIFRNISKNLLTYYPSTQSLKLIANGSNYAWSTEGLQNISLSNLGNKSGYGFIKESFKKTNIRQKLSKKEKLILSYKTALYKNAGDIHQAYQPQMDLPSQTAIIQPLNFYLKKEEAFRRKLRYYNTTVVRKLSVGNNAPYFKTMLKKYFYYYKPSLRYKRTLFTAAMRRGLRKKYTLPKKIIYNSNNLITNPLGSPLSSTPFTNSALLTPPESFGLDTNKIMTSFTSNPNNVDQAYGRYSSTKSYSVLGKRASRYRYQIYKDVLQHWYYTPFNRLLLKFDIDSFINRQPKAHFLTKKEERLLHLRRFLLSEHYNTLRWYASMQHYRTMKSRIGGTKSFSSTVYNQQFQGTFKKIRHLFAITPVQGDIPILKFDQPLFTNNKKTLPSKQNNAASPASNTNKTKLSSYTHEEESNYPLFSTDSLLGSVSAMDQGPLVKSSPNGKDLIADSLVLAGELFKSEQKQNQIRIKQYIEEKRYADLTQILFDGPKPIDDNKGTYCQSPNGDCTIALDNSGEPNIALSQKNLLIKLLKECQRRLNDQTFLKNYINHRIDKREQRFKEAQNEFRKNIDSLKTWLSPFVVSQNPGNLQVSLGASPANQESTAILSLVSGVDKPLQNIVTTGETKALNDGVVLLSKLDPSLSRKPLFNKIINNRTKGFNKLSAPPLISVLKNLQRQEQIRQSVTSIDLLTVKYYKRTGPLEVNKNNFSYKLGQAPKGAGQKTIGNIRRADISKDVKKQKTRIQQILKPILFIQNKLLTKRAEKNIEWWRQKQRVMKKRKTTRKKKRLTKIQKVYAEAQELSAKPITQNLALSESIQSDSVKYLKQLSQENFNGSVALRNLRKKVDSQEASIESKKTGFKVILQKIFLKKFNKNKTSKGRRIRGLLGNRGFAFVRKPKNGSYFSLAELRSNQASGINLTDNGAAYRDATKQSYFFLSKIDQRNLLKELKAKIDLSTKGPSSLSSSAPPINSNSSSSLSLINLLVKESLKKAPVKKRSKRSFRKSRNQFARNHSKYRKRSNHGMIKLRGLNKKLKRIEAIQDLQNWWWHTYLPNFIQKNKTYKDKLSLNKKARVTSESTLFKPLSTKEALEIRSKTVSAPPIKASLQLAYPNEAYPPKADILNLNTNILNTTSGNPPEAMGIAKKQSEQEANGSYSIDKIYENLFVIPEQTSNRMDRNAHKTAITKNQVIGLPFYAGWDESLRKFVVTNRLLSRRDTGFSVILDSSNFPLSATPAKGAGNNTLQFTKAPMQGLNEASFLNLQNEMPFNAYIIDQFMPNNQSFYAPLGWKRFQFRHSLLKNWFNKTAGSATYLPGADKRLLLKNKSISNLEYFNYSKSQAPTGAWPTSNYGASFGVSSNPPQGGNSYKVGQQLPDMASKKATLALQNRRIKKRYKLLKQTPINLMYVPTGALLNEVLPSHYISIFDKQTRFPRNRYLKRFLPSKAAEPITTPKNTREAALFEISNSLINKTNSNNLIYDGSSGTSFTLRKRIKPRRKYHQKRFTKKDGLIFPRRIKFGSLSPAGGNNSIETDLSQLNSPSAYGRGVESFRLRPSSQTKQSNNQNITKTKSKKRVPKTNPIRLRQLRRREFQQVYKPLQRFEPRNGGFIWSGDYLRLQIIPMTKLDSLKAIAITKANLQNNLVGTNLESKDLKDNNNPQAKIKNKINIQPIGLLPRKYLIEKHNLKVLKKKAYVVSKKGLTFSF
jgi:hypothetical protein